MTKSLRYRVGFAALSFVISSGITSSSQTAHAQTKKRIAVLGSDEFGSIEIKGHPSTQTIRALLERYETHQLPLSRPSQASSYGRLYKSMPIGVGQGVVVPSPIAGGGTSYPAPSPLSMAHGGGPTIRPTPRMGAVSAPSPFPFSMAHGGGLPIEPTPRIGSDPKSARVGGSPDRMNTGN
ncbi:hypothetical protein BH10CYA1_BH10CYA1_62590 [soil metagenome]